MGACGSVVVVVVVEGCEEQWMRKATKARNRRFASQVTYYLVPSLRHLIAISIDLFAHT
jgi:hypothetical protein